GRSDVAQKRRHALVTQGGKNGGVAAETPGGERGEKRIPTDGFDPLPRRGHGLVDGEIADADQAGCVSHWPPPRRNNSGRGGSRPTGPAADRAWATAAPESPAGGSPRQRW